eukprot:2249334-Alexandrium_andersonii.AAC.1
MCNDCACSAEADGVTCNATLAMSWRPCAGSASAGLNWHASAGCNFTAGSGRQTVSASAEPLARLWG